MTLNQLFCKLTKEKFHEVILGGQQKCLQSSQNNATYHPMTRDTDVTYKTVNIFSSDKCFICFNSDVPHYMVHVEQWYVHTLESHFCYFL